MNMTLSQFQGQANQKVGNSSSIMETIGRLQILITQTKDEMARLEHKLAPIMKPVEESCSEPTHPSRSASCDFHQLLVMHEEELAALQARITNLVQYCEL